MAVNAPVGNAGAFINKPFFKQAYKSFAYGAAAPFVHGKALAFPIARNAQAF